MTSIRSDNFLSDVRKILQYFIDNPVCFPIYCPKLVYRKQLNYFTFYLIKTVIFNSITTKKQKNKKKSLLKYYITVNF